MNPTSKSAPPPCKRKATIEGTKQKRSLDLNTMTNDYSSSLERSLDLNTMTNYSSSLTYQNKSIRLYEESATSSAGSSSSGPSSAGPSSTEPSSSEPSVNNPKQQNTVFKSVKFTTALLNERNAYSTPIATKPQEPQEKTQATTQQYPTFTIQENNPQTGLSGINLLQAAAEAIETDTQVTGT